MDGSRNTFRATLFLEEAFDFLHENQDSSDEENRDSQDQSRDNQTHKLDGGPANNDADATETSLLVEQSCESTRTSAASSSSYSKDSDISQTTNERISSVSNSSQESRSSSSNEDKDRNKLQEAEEMLKNDTINNSQIVSNNSNQNKLTSDQLGEKGISKTLDISKSNKVICSDTDTENITKPTANEICKSISSKDDSQDDSSNINIFRYSIKKPEEQLVKPSDIKSRNLEVGSEYFEAQMVDKEIKCETLVLETNVHDDKLNSENCIQEKVHPNKNNTRVSQIIQNEFSFLLDEEYDDQTELTNKNTVNLVKESSKTDILIGKNVNDPGEVKIRSNLTQSNRKTDTMVISETFNFLNDESIVGETSTEVDAALSAKDELLVTGQQQQSASNKLNVENTTSVLSSVPDCVIPSHVEKPRSPLVDRVKQSERAAPSKDNNDTSSSRSSCDSDTDNSEPFDDSNVFDLDSDVTGSHTLPRTKLYDREHSNSSTNEDKALFRRSDSTSTTISEREFAKNYQEKRVVIERPYLRKNKKSPSVSSSYKRFTKKIPDIEKTTELEREDPSQSYGFHIFKNERAEDSYNPVYVSTVEIGSLAHQKGIEIGDSIITANGEIVCDFSEKELEELIKRDPNKVVLGLGAKVFHPPMKSGYLVKQSSGVLKSTKKRWFELKQDNCLYYYKTENDTQPLGVICLSNYSVVKATDVDPYTLKLFKYDMKTYFLKASSVEDMMSWGDVLRQAADAKMVYPVKSSHHVYLAPLQIKNPDCYGFLQKRSNTSTMYHKRYCILKEASLYYYTEQKAVTAKGVAHLHGYKCTSEFTHGKRYGFTMSPPDINMKTFQFLAETAADRKRWIDAMKTIEKWKPADEEEENT